MPKVTHTKVLNAPVPDIWDYITKIDNWAPLVMGYKGHEVLNEIESIWYIKANIAVITHPFKGHVTIVEKKDNEFIRFNLNGITDPTVGNGKVTFEPVEIHPNKTKITFDLEVNGRGVTVSVVNHIVGPRLDPMVTNLLSGIANKIEYTHA